MIITNPPFGTTESSSLGETDKTQYDLPGGRGQHLFLQKMVASGASGCDICTVIDEGILNNGSASDLRKYILQRCRVRAVVRLPEETFKPNKINVSSSVILLEKRKEEDIDFSDQYNVNFFEIHSLGYTGSGEKLEVGTMNNF